jgi:hypothetical protein
MSLNVLYSQVVDIFDFILAQSKQITSPMTWKKLGNTFGFEISCLLTKREALSTIINVDTLYSNITRESYLQKIPIITDFEHSNCKLVTIFVKPNTGFTLQLSTVIANLDYLNLSSAED